MPAYHSTELTKFASFSSLLEFIDKRREEPGSARRQLHLPISDNYISPILQGGLGGCSPPCS